MAKTSNLNFVSPKPVANGVRDRAAILCAQRAGKLHPWLFGTRYDRVSDLHFEPCVILDALERRRQLEDVLGGDVFGFDECAHAVKDNQCSAAGDRSGATCAAGPTPPPPARTAARRATSRSHRRQPAAGSTSAPDPSDCRGGAATWLSPRRGERGR